MKANEAANSKAFLFDTATWMLVDGIVVVIQCDQKFDS